MLKRKLNLFKILEDNNSCILFGPRGTGKTALCLEFLKSRPYSLVVDLLDRDTYQQHLSSPGLFRSIVSTRLERGQPLTVLVDEVQRMPEFLDDVHSLLEEESRSKRNRLQFLLTGSSARKLKRGAANLLAGRAITLKLHTLSVLETEIDLNRAMTIGLLPSFYLSSTNPFRRLKSYADTYIREEVLQEALVRKGASFERFLDFAAQVNSEPVNMSKLARASNISSPTADSFFSILTDILLVRRIDVWNYSVRAQMAMAPKYYFFDCGVLNALWGELGIALKPSSYRYGKLFETFIINQILAANDYLERDFKPYFWRTASGSEVDLVLSRNPRDVPRAVEIKAAVSPEPDDLAGLKAFKRDHPEAQLSCICQTKAAYKVEGINILPWKEGILQVLEN